MMNATVKSNSFIFEGVIINISFCEESRIQSIVKTSSNSNKGLIISTRSSKCNMTVLETNRFYDEVGSEEYLEYYLQKINSSANYD